MSEVVLVDVALHLRHLVFIRQDDHHGGVAPVGQHDDSGVVVEILVEVKAACPLHHVNLNLGVFVHVEVALLCQVSVKVFLPLSCCDAAKGKSLQLHLSDLYVSAVRLN